MAGLVKAHAGPAFTRWHRIRIDELLNSVGWTRLDLDDASAFWYGRPFVELFFRDGKDLLKSLDSLAGFKRWRDGRTV